MDPLSLDDKLNFQLLEENLEMESPNLSDLESPITKPLADGFHSDSIHKGMTLKEQERIIDDLRKENYNLKMRIYFLEDTMNKMSPAYVNEAIKENVDLRTKLERSNAEKKQLVDQLQRLQTNSQSTSSQINNQLESHHQLQLNMFKSHIETLENQLMELREAKLHLEDKDLRQRESQLSTKNQAELALQQVDSLKIELQFIKDQSNRYKQELIDTQVQLTATEQKLNKLTKSRSSHLMENEDVENGENEQKGNLHSQCLEKMKHLKSHIQAQTLILSEREKQLIELQNQVSILTHELNSRDHLDVYQPPNASSRSQGQGQMGTSSALYIQLTELNRQANERAREATKLQSELNMQKDVLTKTVREIEAQFEKELQQLRHQVQESKDQYQRVHEKYVQLSAKHDAMVASHKDQNKNIKEAEKLWTVERQNYEDNLYRLNRSNIELKNEVIQKGKEIFSLQEEISSRVFKEQSVVDQMEAIQQKCHKVDANTQSTRFEMEGLEEELKKAHAKSEEVENAWRKETERRCQVEQRELARVAELDEFLRTERQVNKNLKVRLTSLEKDMEVLQQTHEREVNELQALARVGNEMDRLQTMDQFKSKLTALEKENKLYQEMLGKLKNALKGKVTELQTYKDRLSHVQATADNHYYRLTHLLQQRNLSTSFPSSSPTNPIDTPTTKTMATESDAAPDLTVKSPRRPTSLIEDHSSTTVTISYDTLYQLFFKLSTILGKNISEFSFHPIASILETKVVDFVNELLKLKSYFENRCKSLESHWTKEFRLFLNKLEHKSIQIQKYEEAIRTATLRVRQWKSILNQQHIEALTTETEKLKLQKKLNDSLELEEQAWQVKLNDVEKRLKESELNAEMEGMEAKKKIKDLVHSLRNLEQQLDASKKLNQRYKEIFEHQKQKLDSAAQSQSITRLEEIKQAHRILQRSLRRKESLLNGVLVRLENIQNPTSELLITMDEIKQNLASFKEDASGDTQLSDSLSRTNSIGSDPFPNTPPRNSGVGRYITGFDANF